MKLYIGVCHPLGMSLYYVPREDMDWYFPFTTKKNGDGLHSRVAFL